MTRSSQARVFSRPEDLRIINFLDLAHFLQQTEDSIVLTSPQAPALVLTGTGDINATLAMSAEQQLDSCAYLDIIQELDYSPLVPALAHSAGTSRIATIGDDVAAQQKAAQEAHAADIATHIQRIDDLERHIAEHTARILDSERRELAVQLRTHKAELASLAEHTQLGRASAPTAAPVLAMPDASKPHLRFPSSSTAWNEGGGARPRNEGGGERPPRRRDGSDGRARHLTRPAIPGIIPRNVPLEEDGRPAMKYQDKPKMAYGAFPPYIKEPVLAEFGITEHNYPEKSVQPCVLCDRDGYADHWLAHCQYLLCTTEAGKKIYSQLRLLEKAAVFDAHKPAANLEAVIGMNVVMAAEGEQDAATTNANVVAYVCEICDAELQDPVQVLTTAKAAIMFFEQHCRDMAESQAVADSGRWLARCGGYRRRRR